jgi:hypothetical protein
MVARDAVSKKVATIAVTTSTTMAILRAAKRYARDDVVVWVASAVADIPTSFAVDSRLPVGGLATA